MRLEDALAGLPIVAILRGIRPGEAVAIGETLLAEGILAMEVPLNSPDPFDSIGRMADALGRDAAIGAGTVLATGDVPRVADAGASFVVAPDVRPAVVRAAIARGLTPVPGFATPTEAFRAIRSGARYLKLFPAANLGIGFIAAVRAVLPPDVAIVAVGGVDTVNAAQWLVGGAAALGTGSSLYRPGMRTDDLRKTARQLVAAIRRDNR